MQIRNLEAELSGNAYPGRGIVIGRSACGKYAVAAYFIMGRSQSSRNRIFTVDGEGIRTEAFDPATLLVKPELIIYSPVRVLGTDTIVTNGDQTDTVYDGIKSGLTFEQSLRSRKYEHDAPNYTPRISGIMHFADGYSYELSILKSHNGNPDICERHTYSYDSAEAGEGHFIHTYMGDGNPLPSYSGEPTLVDISGDIDSFTESVWNSLNADNRVSLFTRFIELETGKYETRIVNKNIR